MNKEKLIFALIPARSGSKGIKEKNIIDFKGKPLFTHSIIQGLKSQFIDEVFVSTDSEKYAEIARSYGAKVPFLRPSEISKDDSLTFPSLSITSTPSTLYPSVVSSPSKFVSAISQYID